MHFVITANEHTHPQMTQFISSLCENDIVMGKKQENNLQS